MTDEVVGRGYWNHRVVKRRYPTGEVEFAIHETFYNIGMEPGVSITTEAVAACAETVEGLRETLQKMLASLGKPVLDYETREEVGDEFSDQHR